MTDANAQPLCSLFARYSYHVVTSAACMPASCKFGIYKRVAIVEVDHHERPSDYVPERIVDLRGVRVAALWDRLNVGLTEQCAYRRALVEAESMAAELRQQRLVEASQDAGLLAA